MTDSIPIEWRIDTGLVAYPDALTFMEDRANAIAAGEAAPCVWLLQHPPLYTGGTSAKAADVLSPSEIPIYPNTGRGGQYTYHGPGQVVGYVMVPLAQWHKDVRWFVAGLEEWLMRTCAHYGIAGERHCGRVGVWITGHDRTEKKIGAVGVRLRRWVSLHGVSLNVAPNLDHFRGIVPCGLHQYGITSLAHEGINASVPEVMRVMQQEFLPALKYRHKNTNTPADTKIVKKCY